MWLFGWRVYFGDVWNWIELFSYATYYIGLVLQYGGTVECDEAARIFRAFSFMFFAYQIIRYGSLLETFGVLIPVLQLMVRNSYYNTSVLATTWRRKPAGIGRKKLSHSTYVVKSLKHCGVRYIYVSATCFLPEWYCGTYRACLCFLAFLFLSFYCDNILSVGLLYWASCMCISCSLHLLLFLLYFVYD